MVARLERWRDPRYCVLYRVEDWRDDWKRTSARDYPCSDCGHACVGCLELTLGQLVRPYLILCGPCADQRAIEDGPFWTFRVRP